MQVVADLLKQLVRIPSKSGEEGQLSSFIQQYCMENNLDCTMVGNNVIVRVGSGDTALIYNAHIDTVEAAGEWEYPPTGDSAGVEENGRIYGLGASDNKASVAALLEAAVSLADDRLGREVIFTFTVKEEVDGTGTRHVLDWLEQHVDCSEVVAVVTEPTCLEWIEVGCKGTVWTEVTLVGEGGHSTADVANPIDEMYRLWRRLEDILPASTPEPSVELTQVAAGNSINTVPETAEAVFDVRTVPGMTVEDVATMFEQACEPLPVDIAFELAKQPCPPGRCEDEDFIATVSQVTGITETLFAQGANDSCFFSEYGIPAVVLGPGTKSVIHGPDEYVEKEMLEKGVAVFQEIAKEFTE